MSKQTARIENWMRSGNQLIGSVRDHARQGDFNPNHVQRTSDLISFDEEAGVAETLNTIYTLGKKIGE